MKVRTDLGVIAILVMAITSVVATAQPAATQDVPSIAIRPADPLPDDPNGGQWFFAKADPGETFTVRAEIFNPAAVEQRVELDVRDLMFQMDGTPSLTQEVDNDVGSWAHVETPSVTVPPTSSRTVTVAVSVPRDAEPGDHIGGFVAQTTNPQGDFQVERRLVRRFYVTVSGDARQSFLIASVSSDEGPWIWPESADVTVVLENDGRVRLTPTVSVNGQEAAGARVLLSRSSEPYSADINLPWYGGPVRLSVEATTDEGLARTAAKTVWVIPWGLIILIVVSASALYAGRRWWKRRKSATAELKQDIQRLEQLITQQAKAQQSTAGVGAGLPGADDVPDDEEAIILAALKRARRSDDDTALARIALAKHMTSGGGLDLILEALQKHDGKHRGALLDAAVSYGADALSAHERFAELSDETQAELGERLVTTGEPVSGNGNGKPAKVPQPVVGQTDSDVLRTELAKVKGVGPAKQEALVSRFGSLDAIRAADVEDLTEVPGIGYATARDILDQLDG